MPRGLDWTHFPDLAVLYPSPFIAPSISWKSEICLQVTHSLSTEWHFPKFLTVPLTFSQIGLVLHLLTLFQYSDPPSCVPFLIPGWKTPTLPVHNHTWPLACIYTSTYMRVAQNFILSSRSSMVHPSFPVFLVDSDCSFGGWVPWPVSSSARCIFCLHSFLTVPSVIFISFVVVCTVGCADSGKL